MLIFVRQLLRDRVHVGAVMPSWPRLASTMTRGLRRHIGRKRVLEVGPGTGSITRFLVRTLRPGDELELVELNPAFCRRLEKRLLQPYLRRNPGVTVRLHCGPVEHQRFDAPFDHIICSLPFNNFPPALVRAIFRRMLDALAVGGELVYFEYAGVRVLKGPLVGSEGRRRLRRIGATGKILRRRHAGRTHLVLGNVPPAVAVRLVR